MDMASKLFTFTFTYVSGDEFMASGYWRPHALTV